MTACSQIPQDAEQYSSSFSERVRELFKKLAVEEEDAERKNRLLELKALCRLLVQEPPKLWGQACSCAANMLKPLAQEAHARQCALLPEACLSLPHRPHQVLCTC